MVRRDLIVQICDHGCCGLFCSIHSGHGDVYLYTYVMFRNK